MIITIPAQRDVLLTAKRDGMTEIIAVNEALLAFAHCNIFPWYLCITLEAQDLIENGMPAPDESALLFEIGDEIEGIVSGGKTENGAENALFLARSTWNAQRELLFYIHDPEITHAALQTLLESRNWAREWDYSMVDDPEWEKASHVFQLFPQAHGLHS